MLPIDAASADLARPHPSERRFPEFTVAIDPNTGQRPGQPKPWEGQTHSAPQYILEYDVFPPHQNIDRRWTVEHPPPRSPAA